MGGPSHPNVSSQPPAEPHAFCSSPPPSSSPSQSPSPPPIPASHVCPQGRSNNHGTVQRIRRTHIPNLILGINWTVRRYKIANQDQKTQWIFYKIPAHNELRDPPPPPPTLALLHRDIFISHRPGNRTTTAWMWTVNGEEQGWARTKKGDPCPYNTCLGYVLNWSQHGKPVWVKPGTRSRAERVHNKLLS